jgi:hypothetical protein
MVTPRSYDPHYGFTGGKPTPPSVKRHLIVFTSDEERTEIPMDLTPEEAKLLVRLAQTINGKAKWSADVRMTLNEVLPAIKGRALAIHPESVCAGQVCCIHNPTDHHMRSWTQLWRADRALMERLCPEHGVGHPDPDHITHYATTHTEGETWAEGVHGCCGCCRPSSAAPQGDAVA